MCGSDMSDSLGGIVTGASGNGSQFMRHSSEGTTFSVDKLVFSV